MQSLHHLVFKVFTIAKATFFGCACIYNGILCLSQHRKPPTGAPPANPLLSGWLTGVSVVFLLLFSCTAEGSWDILRQHDEIFQILDGYSHRVKVTINNSAQNESFTNFPVLVVLNASRVSYSNISADGTGIKFISSDFTEELAYEVEEWNSGGESVFWVKIPSITALSNTDYFWIYFSAENNTDSTNPTDVWSNNYLAVWHMNDSDDSIKDSTSFGLDGVPELGLYGTSKGTGIIAGAQVFDNADANITINSTAAFDNLDPVTFSFWMYENGYQEGDTIIEKGSLKISLLEWDPINSFPIANSLDFCVDYDGGVNLELIYRMSWITSEWSSFYLTWTGSSDSDKVAIYNNNLELSNPFLKTTGNGNRLTDTVADLIIGNNSTNNRSFNGCLDEIRISNVVRTPAWIKAQQMSMADTFLSYGAEENVSN